MRFDAKRLQQLLPAVYGIRDAQLGGPLLDLLTVLAEQINIIEEDLDQLYEDQFIETCAQWAVPYIGDAIGYRMLHDIGSGIGRSRAEVAHTIDFRRRKGTLSALEDLARDVTGWRASAAEFFPRLITSQYMNHVRPQIYTAPDLRKWESLQQIGSAFDSIPRTVDVRRIEPRRGRHNIPNIGIFLWRLEPFALTHSPAVRVDARRYRFHPQNIDQPLFTLPINPATETTLVGPRNVPVPISRRQLDAHPGYYYPLATDNTTLSMRILVDRDDGLGLTRVDQPDICSCNLGDLAGNWAHLPPAGKFAIDPVLGRIGLPPEATLNWRVLVDFHYGFPAQVGGGEYARTLSTSPNTLRVPDDRPTIQQALDDLGGAGIVQITNSGRYEEVLSINVNAGSRIELQAADRVRPTLVLGGECVVEGGARSEVVLSGLLMIGHRLHVPAGTQLALLTISHCTLVPGWTLAPDCQPQFPNEASLLCELSSININLERTIIGPIRAPDGANLSATDCMIDAMSADAPALCANGGLFGASLTLQECTVVGRILAKELPLISNCILFARPDAAGDAPVRAEFRQHGCVRFTWLPPTSRTPRRHLCLPETAPSARDAVPRFTSLRYGQPGYAQLSVSSGAALLTGAEDEVEPGVYHHLLGTQRETNMRVRLDEYLRVGLHAGIFYEN